MIQNDADSTTEPWHIPDTEPARQYYFIDLCKDHVRHYMEEKGRAPRACVVNMGCQMNAKDAEKLCGILQQAGFFLTEKEEDADLILYNTCTVRDNADQKVYGRLGFVNGLKQKNPDLKVALCGCMMQQPEAVYQIRKCELFVDLILGTHSLYAFADFLAEMLGLIPVAASGNSSSGGMIVHIEKEARNTVEKLPVCRKYSYKSGVNIMYGCDNFCSYCIVPYVRGRERSRAPEEILEEIKALAEDGVVEVMLLGQNVNSYGKGLPSGISFAELLRKAAEIDGIRRIRFMTSHPKDLSPELIQVMQETPKICRHLHLPLQAGSNRILSAMNRRYTREQYLELTDRIKTAMPDISLTTDLMVGFPGETYADVQDTIDMVRRVEFDNAFTFLYSPRTGTPASSMENPVPEAEIRRGFDELLSVVQETAKMRASRLQGQVMEALIEEKNAQDSSLVTGRLSNNMLVHIPGDASDIGHFMPVFLEECHGFYYTGKRGEQDTTWQK